ncbi:MAG TPA: VOC family protein [Rhodanobacteraceae bacterium]|nr:VOC family protein [Rhodanobacteraceae bacterium]
MSRQLFVNLPVRDLAKATAFYAAIGAQKNPQFSDDTAACMVISDSIFVMLLTYPKWSSFTPKPIVDAKRENEVMLALSCDSREAVDQITETAGANGGIADISPKDEYDFMYGRSFEDPDGHAWGPFFMDLSKMPKQA